MPRGVIHYQVTFWAWFGNVYLHPDEIKSGFSCDDAHLFLTSASNLHSALDD